MINKHITEEEIQALAMDLVNKDDEAFAHLASCAGCKEKVEAYRLLFTALEAQEPASFGFDLATLVIDKMAEPVPRPFWMTAGLVTLALLGLAIPVLLVVFYGSTVAGLFKGLSPIMLPLIGTGVLTTVIFLLGDMYKQYRKKLAILEMI